MVVRRVDSVARTMDSSHPQRQSPSSAPPDYEPPDMERPASAAPTEAQLENESPAGVSARDDGHDPYAALRSRDYRMYCLGWVTSVLGRQIQEVAIGYEIYERTNSKLALAWIGLSQAVPMLACLIPAGHMADRFDRRKIIMLTQGVWVVCALGLAFLSHTRGSIPLMYGLLGLSAAAHAVGWPARSSLLPQIVPPEIFNNAVTW